MVDAINIKEESSKSLSRIAPLRDEAVSRDVEANPVGNPVLSRTVSKARGNAFAPTSRERDKKVVPVVNKIKVSNVHERNVTDDARPNAEDISSRNGKRDSDANSSTVITDVPNAFAGEHVILGWPTWLASVAAEAIKGWLPRRADSFEKLEKVKFNIFPCSIALLLHAYRNFVNVMLAYNLKYFSLMLGLFR